MSINENENLNKDFACMLCSFTMIDNPFYAHFFNSKSRKLNDINALRAYMFHSKYYATLV